MPTRNELKQLAKTRLQEAKTLFDKGLYDGACYLAGYVIELALKARICKILDLTEYLQSGEISRAFKIHKYVEKVRQALEDFSNQNHRGCDDGKTVDVMNFYAFGVLIEKATILESQPL